MTKIEFELNGQSITANVDATTTLRELLRKEFDLTGTKASCMSGRCGVCTVHLDGRAVKSCLTMAGRVHGSSVKTIEGVANDDLHDVQQAFDEAFALQCGYCTPGFIMAALPFVDSTAEPTRDEIRDAIKGNVCRCTGYEKILDAIEDVSD